jgi:arylsulfatase A-like enzyme
MVAAGPGPEHQAAKAAAQPPRCPDKPNVLLIVIDTLRFDATQLDPHGSNPTPFLRHLQSSGANFTSCYSTFDETPPSHFSLLTGFVDGYKTTLDRPENSIAFQLSRNGYDTFGIVANANLSVEAMRTVMPFSSYENVQDEWLKMPEAEKAGLAPPFDALARHYDEVANDWTRMFLYSSAGEVTRRLQQRLKDARRPFFGFLNLIDAHDPYLPDPAHYDRGGEETSPPSLRFRELPAFLADPTNIPDPVRRQAVIDKINQAGARAWSTTLDLDRAQLNVYARRYRAEVTDADRAIADIFRILRTNGLLDSTIVIITSDHGESLGEDQLITHSFHDKGDREVTHHVPLLIVFPSCYRISRTNVDTAATIADVAPTVYELLRMDSRPLAALASPGHFGRSLLPLLHVRSSASTSVVSTGEGQPIAEDARRKQDAEAVKRLKALGYLGGK